MLTPAYASPEQVRGEEVTAASDVSAISVLAAGAGMAAGIAAIFAVSSSGAVRLGTRDGGAPRLVPGVTRRAAPCALHPPRRRAAPRLPRVGADGRTLVYKWADEEGHASFWSIPAAGGERRRLARLAGPRQLSPRPEFASDGRRLYFTVAERESDVWTMVPTTERP